MSVLKYVIDLWFGYENVVTHVKLIIVLLTYIVVYIIKLWNNFSTM